MEEITREMYESKIKEFFDFAVQLKDGYMKSTDKNIPKKLYLKAIELFGFTQKPKIVEDEKFESQKGLLLYRGVTDPNHHREMIENDRYFVRDDEAFETDAFGIFSSTSKDKALEYTAPPTDSSKVEDNIMHIKVSSDARIAPYKFDGSVSSIRPTCFEERKFLECFDALSEDNKNYMANIFYHYSTILGVLLGYDGYYTNFSTQKYCCLLNRGKMVIPKSDADFFGKKGSSRFVAQAEQAQLGSE